jgi:hypothetical protein
MPTIFQFRSEEMNMFRTMLDLTVLSTDDTSVVLRLSGRAQPITLSVRTYERGAVISIPWHATDLLDAPAYTALKAVLRPHYSHIETRTETDPRFRAAAAARAERPAAREMGKVAV